MSLGAGCQCCRCDGNLSVLDGTVCARCEERERQERRHVNPAARGYHAVHRDGETNHCPGCGRTHWIIGRVTAECAFCGAALPLESSLSKGNDKAPTFQTRGAGHGRVR